MNKLRVLFMGTPDFALPCCDALNHNHHLIGLITQPDRPKGRGGLLTPPPIKKYAADHRIPCYQPETLKDGAMLPLLTNLAPDIIVVAAYGKILPAYILDFPPFGCINVHGSLLPKYRGAAPIQRAVINGEKQTGVTIMKMNAGMDTGEIILQEIIPISDSDTSGTVFERLANASPSLLLRAIKQIVSGTAVYTPQDEKEATYAPMIEKNEAKIDFSQPSNTVRHLIMGMNPSPGAFFECDGYRLKILSALPGKPSDGAPGTIAEIGKEGIFVICGDQKSILIKKIQKQGKNVTDAFSYACGAKLCPAEKIR